MMLNAVQSRGITKRIGSIKFSCISPDEIRSMSATKVITADTYDDEGYPIDLGLMDLHMGVIEPGLRCKTCQNKVEDCPGHFGHIELARPIIHVGFIKDIKMLLESTCANCGRLMLDPEKIEETKRDMESMRDLGSDTIDVKNFSKVTAKGAVQQVCPHCGEKQFKIKLDKPTTFRIDDPTRTNQKLLPHEVRARLEKIPDEDLRALGINPETCRPEWMVLTVLAVPPVTVRPSITLDSGDRSEDDLTHKLVDIIRINQRLRENRDSGSPQLIVEDLWELLQYHVTTYFDNQTSGIPPARHRSGRPLKTLSQRLKGKEGRFRSNLSGKRVNFSSRTVISPDPLLSINDVGIPVKAARELTVPMVVNEENLQQARDIVAYGPDHTAEDDRFDRGEQVEYRPGANYVIRTDGRKIRVTPLNAETVAEGLEVGYTIERQLQEGDVVLFNRQPSLHRMSMMAHRIKVMPGKTFRFNLCVCPPYNADFDGDEMNLHVLQSPEARAEARYLMQVQENILSPRYGGPIIGGIHDHITGSFYLTYKNPRFDLFHTMNILSKLEDIEIPEPEGFDEKGEPYWTGRQIFSVVLPKGLNMEFKSNVDKEEGEEMVKIVDGKLVQGTIDVKGVGNSKGKILDRIARDYGSDAARDFINKVTRVALGAIMDRGFSTGISDEDIPDSAKREIKDLNDSSIDRVAQLVQDYHDGVLEQMPGRSLRETLEMEVMGTLGKARDDSGKIAGRYLGMDNPAVVMAKSGARGSMLNLSQMAGCVGQQAVRGERLSRGYQDRTLSHFPRNDLGAYARGFCSNSYKSGLSPTEFFFHAMGGREGLVDTAVRTSRSGYMQRRLVSALEDLKLTNDGTIRNTIGTIVQFRYGEDGVDPSKAVGGKAIDMEQLFKEVFGLRHDMLFPAKEEVRSEGDDYGTREKDENEYYSDGEDSDELGDSSEYDSDNEGGE